MVTKATSAHITTVTEEHTVVVPPELPAGTTVAVIAMPSTIVDDAARRAHFDATFAAIREVMAQQPAQAVLRDDAIDAIIERARAFITN